MHTSNSAVNDRSVFLENIFRPVQTHSIQLFSFLFIVLFMQRVCKLPPLFQILQLPAKSLRQINKTKNMFADAERPSAFNNSNVVT